MYMYMFFCKIECCSNLCDVVEAMPFLDSPRHCQGATISSQQLMTKHVREFDNTPFVVKHISCKACREFAKTLQSCLEGTLRYTLHFGRRNLISCIYLAQNSYIEPPASTRFLNSRIGRKDWLLLSAQKQWVEHVVVVPPGCKRLPSLCPWLPPPDSMWFLPCRKARDSLFRLRAVTLCLSFCLRTASLLYNIRCPTEKAMVLYLTSRR